MTPWLTIYVTTSCAYVHKVQLAEIDSRPHFQKVKIQVITSETGVATKEAVDFASKILKTKDKEAKQINNLISAFQSGPKTGNPVYNESYAENILALLREQCPSGKISSLTSVRETNRYPIVSGEIVKFTGYCLTQKRSP